MLDVCVCCLTNWNQSEGLPLVVDAQHWDYFFQSPALCIDECPEASLFSVCKSTILFKIGKKIFIFLSYTNIRMAGRVDYQLLLCNAASRFSLSLAARWAASGPVFAFLLFFWGAFLCRLPRAAALVHRHLFSSSDVLKRPSARLLKKSKNLVRKPQSQLLKQNEFLGF